MAESKGSLAGVEDNSDGLNSGNYDPGSMELINDSLTKVQVEQRARTLATDAQLGPNEAETLVRGAHLAHDPRSFYTVDASDDEKQALQDEVHHRFRQPWAVWWVSLVSALAATVQGMDETVISGAQLIFLKYFGLENDPRLIGFINACPYLICATVGCWIAIPCNHYLGRRGTIFLWCLVSVGASSWQAVSTSWQSFMGSRLVLGLSIGANSATVAVYTAECAPTAIRGGLVMFWQIFVAFGIMLGYVMGAAFVNVQEPLNWRLMIGSQLVPPIFVVATVYFGPESPRYYVSRQRYGQAYKSLMRLRHSKLQAARDLFCIVEAVKNEESLRSGRTFLSDVRDIIQVPRVRYAAFSSWFIMFSQNFCGINATTYYTGQVFADTGASTQTAIYASLGAGAMAFIFALPIVKYIDIWGRRFLLISSLFAMCLCTLWTGFSFLAEDDKTRLALVAVGIYLFQTAYAPGQGVVPFVYASESFPLYMRSLGMSFATATTWLFSFSLTMAWPSQLVAFTPTGAFCWYAAWCLFCGTVAYFVIPETRGLSLEELDFVFSMPMTMHAQNKLHQLQYWLRLKTAPPTDLQQSAREFYTRAREENRRSEKPRSSKSDVHQVEIGSRDDENRNQV